MLLYIKNLLPQLEQFSKKLDQQSIFIDKPWVMIDDAKNYHHYSFQKDGKLIMALNGNVQIGSWQYIAGSNSLLIDRLVDKILLNQVFVQDGLMFLKKDGNDDDNWILINKRVIPDLDYTKYLRNFFITSKGLKVIKALEGQYYVTQYHGHDCGEEVYDSNLNPVQNSIIKSSNNKSIIIKGGKIESTYYTKTFKSISGQVITINLSYYNQIFINNTVLVNNDYNSTGKYKFKPKILDEVKSIEIKDGKVTKVYRGIEKGPFILLVVFSLFVCAAIFIAIPTKTGIKTENSLIQSIGNINAESMRIKDTTITTTVIPPVDEVAKDKVKSGKEESLNRSASDYSITVPPGSLNEEVIFCNENTALKDFKSYMRFYYPDWKIYGRPLVREINLCRFRIQFKTMNPHNRFEKEVMIAEIYIDSYRGKYDFNMATGDLY